MIVYDLIKMLTQHPPDALVTIKQINSRKRQRVLNVVDRDFTGRHGDEWGERVQILTNWEDTDA